MKFNRKSKFILQILINFRYETSFISVYLTNKFITTIVLFFNCQLLSENCQAYSHLAHIGRYNVAVLEKNSSTLNYE